MCLITENQAAGYTAKDAPVVIPVNTPGYSAMAAPSDYVEEASAYTDAGFIYVNVGCRGRNHGVPAGVTDLKAAVRYIRYSRETIPGSMDRIFTFGMSGGGAQSALMGATGDSELYTPYLEAIGAAVDESDAIAGSMCWCPVTSLDYANEAYEWNMGSTRTDLDTDTKALSDSMAAAFAEYLNNLELKDSEGNILMLTESEQGIWQAGSYYDYLKSQIELSLNHFLEDTSFPYTSGGSGNPGGPNGEFSGRQDGHTGDRTDRTPEGRPERDANNGFIDQNGNFQNDGISRGAEKPARTESKTYETVQEYIDDLNSDGQWIIYDSASNTASITSIDAFVSKCKNASKNVGAFDDLEAAQGENTLFGYGDGKGAHFDPVMAELLAGTEYEKAFKEDLTKTDALGTSVSDRVNMYNPMYYLSDYYAGYQTSNAARFWRIRTGINQGDTSLTTEVNLALALENYGGRDVDFETIWGQGHTMAERTGDSSENFISWVNRCLQKN
ncbi:MAG: subtype A tannase [Enterocloster sp.]